MASYCADLGFPPESGRIITNVPGRCKATVASDYRREGHMQCELLKPGDGVGGSYWRSIPGTFLLIGKRCSLYKGHLGVVLTKESEERPQ